MIQGYENKAHTNYETKGPTTKNCCPFPSGERSKPDLELETISDALTKEIQKLKKVSKVK